MAFLQPHTPNLSPHPATVAPLAEQSWLRINITAVGAWYGNFTFAKRSDGPAASKVSKLNRIVVACCAEYQADLEIINDKAKVFWNPYGTQNGNALSEL